MGDGTNPGEIKNFAENQKVNKLYKQLKKFYSD